MGFTHVEICLNHLSTFMTYSIHSCVYKVLINCILHSALWPCIVSMTSLVIFSVDWLFTHMTWPCACIFTTWIRVVQSSSFVWWRTSGFLKLFHPQYLGSYFLRKSWNTQWISCVVLLLFTIQALLVTNVSWNVDAQCMLSVCFMHEHTLNKLAHATYELYCTDSQACNSFFLQQ